MQFKDYYEILGVSRDVTAVDLKKAFRKLARKYHPDISKEPDAQARMQEINEANTVLSDPEKRAAYDQLGRGYQSGQDFRPPPDWDAGFEFSERGSSPGGGRGFSTGEAGEARDFSDFFAELFGGMGGSQRNAFYGRQGPLHARGEDHRAKVLLDIEDAYTTPTRQISLRAPQVDNEGHIELVTRTLNVKIPKGVRQGQVIRLAGQGAPGANGAPAGDLLLEVHFRPHQRFTPDGRDLHLNLPVAPWEAALGSVIGVDLPDSRLKVRIPEGTQGGRQLRVRGKGLPGNPPGDLLLNVQIVLPPADTPKAREFYQTMERELAFDPRNEGRN